MQLPKWLIIIVATAMSTTSWAGVRQNINVTHFETLQDLSFVDSGGENPQALPTTDFPVLAFSALGRSYELQLQPNDRLLSGTALETLPQDIVLYRGEIKGNADSWVRIVMHNGEPRGLIWDGTDLLAIEAPGDSAMATTTPVIFRLADTVTAPGSMACGAHEATRNGAADYQALVGELGDILAPQAMAVAQLNISAIGDFLFVDSIAGDPALAIATRLNNVDGIFSAQVGVQIVLQETEVFATPGADPFSGTTAPATLLNELGDYREATVIHRSQGLTHLFTGRDLDGATVGTAYSSLLCWDHFGSGLTQATNGATDDSLVAAHEIGHNFGAPHDAEAGSPCEMEPSTFLMAPTFNGSNQFSACSLTQMQPVIAAASCVIPLMGTDVAITSGGALPTLLLGDNANVTFEVRNNGADPATNVSADISLPNNVSFVSASASVGSCTNGAGSVNCQLNTIAGGSTSTISINTLTAAVGADSFNATVAADVDDDAGNNQASIAVTVNPAIDLVVSVPFGVSVLLGQSRTINVPIENVAVLDATGIVMTVVLDAGIRADSANWPVGTCTIVGQQIDCQSASLAAQTSATLTVGLTAVTAGPQQYNVTLAAAEVDRDTSNNNVNGTVTVTVDPPQNSGGGGGSPGVAILLALLWASFGRRTRALSALWITACLAVPPLPHDRENCLRPTESG